ncbi:MAG TPA: hypothetical protein VFR37_19945 [Longimicrobium sp.]|nr:hypothetical protein [Longimicrobium sp.]
MNAFHNPFLGYGEVVFGERFVGRAQALDTLRQYLPVDSPGSSISITGLPKVGKSSLLEQGVMHDEPQLLERHVLPLWVNVSQHPTGSELFRSFVSLTADRLGRLVDNSTALDSMAQKALAPTPLWSDMMRNVQGFFAEVRRHSWRPVFVLDEFDDARFLYSGATSVFQGVRELANNPRFKVVFAIVTRRPIAEIEQEAGGGSSLSEVLHKYRMPLFSDPETEQLLQRLGQLDIEVTDALRERAAEMCGGHPYLLNCLCYEIAEHARLGQRPLDLDMVCRSRGLASTFTEHYTKIEAFLQDVGLYDKLLEIVFGPQVSVLTDHVNMLQTYGMIRPGANGEYVPFSDHYHAHLRSKARSVDLWPVWGETERAVRALLLREFTGKYGDDWPAALSRAQEPAADVLAGCRRRQEYEQRTGNGQASGSLLDFTEPSDLWRLLKCQWSLFVPTFKRDQGYWAKRFDDILPVRRALAHSRPIASASDRLHAEAACHEILACLGKPAPAATA